MDWVGHKYGTGADLTLANGLHLSVAYDSLAPRDAPGPKYRVRVFGILLKERSETFEDGKERAIRVARKWLDEAQNKLSATCS